jgi:aspartate/methionine/tyrosine aminotransferase
VAVRLSDLASAFHADTNPLYRERDHRLGRGLPVVDLASGNVTEQGITFPPDILHRVVADAVRASQRYRPDPLGQVPARQAISAYYRDSGIDVPADRIVLTPGTSLAYWYAFSAFCDPGDEVLAPRPSYPLFDELANLARVRMTHYRLDPSRGWAIDVESVASAITERTRAIILISPHNPTGAVATRREIDAVAALATDRQVPIIADEVFGEFLSGLEPLPRPAAASAPLVITLNGFSKLFALPGMKLGWMAVTGRDPAVNRTLTAFERMSDAFLPVNEIIQAATPTIFSDGRSFLARYRAEIARRREDSLAALAHTARVSYVHPGGGFYAAVRVDTTLDDEALALHILRTAGCLVHPGFFYDLEPTHLVLSLVTAPEAGREALRRVVAAIDQAP